ncbi:hypothetical protein JI435_403800, partial [Parastagonospora nodorum SN15]
SSAVAVKQKMGFVGVGAMIPFLPTPLFLLDDTRLQVNIASGWFGAHVLVHVYIGSLLFTYPHILSCSDTFCNGYLFLRLSQQSSAFWFGCLRLSCVWYLLARPLPLILLGLGPFPVPWCLGHAIMIMSIFVLSSRTTFQHA